MFYHVLEPCYHSHLFYCILYRKLSNAVLVFFFLGKRKKTFSCSWLLFIDFLSVETQKCMLPAYLYSWNIKSYYSSSCSGSIVVFVLWLPKLSKQECNSKEVQSGKVLVTVWLCFVIFQLLSFWLAYEVHLVYGTWGSQHQ